MGFSGNFKPSWTKLYTSPARQGLGLLEQFIPLQLDEYGCHRAGTHLSHMLPVSDLYLRVLYMFFLKHIMQMFCPHVLLKVAFRKKALEQF